MLGHHYQNADKSQQLVNYVEDYLECVESLPLDIQRNVSLLREIDAKYQGIVIICVYPSSHVRVYIWSTLTAIRELVLKWWSRREPNVPFLQKSSTPCSCLTILRNTVICPVEIRITHWRANCKLKRVSQPSVSISRILFVLFCVTPNSMRKLLNLIFSPLSKGVHAMWLSTRSVMNNWGPIANSAII